MSLYPLTVDFTPNVRFLIRSLVSSMRALWPDPAEPPVRWQRACLLEKVLPEDTYACAGFVHTVDKLVAAIRKEETESEELSTCVLSLSRGSGDTWVEESVQNLAGRARHLLQSEQGPTLLIYREEHSELWLYHEDGRLTNEHCQPIEAKKQACIYLF